jgi:hypothetical protein
MGRKAKRHLTPEQRAAMARMQERLRKSPSQTEEERERLRLIGERLGISRLRKTGTALPEPQEPQAPMLRKSRKPGGGNKPKLTNEEIEQGQQTFCDMLEEDRTWANSQEAAAEHLLEKLKLGDRVSWQTVKRRIVAPVLKTRRSQ